MNRHLKSDHLIFRPGDVDLSRSPLRNGLHEGTYVLGAFNPGLCRLPNGNLLMMVRVAEALSRPVYENEVHCIRWDASGVFVVDAWPLAQADMKDPRSFVLKNYSFPVCAVTSLSWLLPVELDHNGSTVIMVHYDKIIAPQYASQEYGIEDARISFIGDRYYMTTCCVSSERHSTVLYASDNGLNYECQGIVLDHQNKDMLLFEGKIKGMYYALTRPLGSCYFAAPPSSPYHPGAAIHLATSPDLQYWKPHNTAFMRARRTSVSNVKIGGGTPPILTANGWLILYHGVEDNGDVGIYRTFWALLDEAEPEKVLFVEDKVPLLEANPALTNELGDQVYLHDIVFTTGMVEHGDDFILASGELDLACRITTIAKEHFSKALHK
jgi:beta-1,2-mannobiose phosphorylase / 1,2-beta-oligomannan phosphorylase